jgi:hypothetical protein
MFPSGVQKAKNDDVIAFHSIEKFVRETAREQTAEIAIIEGMAFRICLQPANRRANLQQQIVAQTRV